MKLRSTKKLSFEEVEHFYKNHGCELLEQYNKNTDFLLFKCKCGEITQRRFLNFRNSPQCSKCSKKHRFNINEAKKCFEEKGCELLENSYKNGGTSMHYKCKCGKKSQITLEKFMIGRFYKDCGIRRDDKKRKVESR